ncbi:MAG TPA: hypothetical protein VKK79_15785 [Candidatus Lokiarchaeia archaeon]|nr:hypothetical protein [Candidatus Lokiarchaeia archaeon]
MPPQIGQRPPSKKSPSKLEIEAEMFAHAKVLERLQAGYEGGEFDESVYQRQLSASLRELFGLQKQYEEKGHSMTAFLAEQEFPSWLGKVLEKIAGMSQDFAGMEHANLATLSQQSYKEFAATASDLTASFITLLDCIKLRGVAQPPLLDEFFGEVIRHAQKLGLKPDLNSRLESLRATLMDHDGDLTGVELDQLEHDVDLLFTEFQMDLKTE